MKLVYFAMRQFTYYIRAKLLYGHRYNKKYLTGRWFSGKYGGVFSVGWKWVVTSAKACRKLGVNESAKWPVSPQTILVHPENIEFHPDDLNNFQGFGVYMQAIGKITIGKGTYIAPNVGIITANHKIGQLEEHDAAKSIHIGKRCWIGMNSVLLPGVRLGDDTIVGAGSVVTKSFPLGDCIIAGNPAKLIRKSMKEGDYHEPKE